MVSILGLLFSGCGGGSNLQDAATPDATGDQDSPFVQDGPVDSGIADRPLEVPTDIWGGDAAVDVDAAPDVLADASPVPDAAPDTSMPGLALSFANCVVTSIAQKTNRIDGVEVAARDLDDDKKSEIAVALRGDNRVLTMRPRTDGTFQVISDRTSGSSPRDIDMAHFDTDGRLDLVVSNMLDFNVGVMLGTGSGAVAPAATFGAGRSYHIGIGDLNEDSKLDLVVGNTDGSNLALLLGNGDGTFATRTWILAGTQPMSPIVADFDRDGHLDVATTIRDISPSKGGIAVFLGKGDGTLVLAGRFESGGQTPFLSLVGDFTSDGSPDLIVTHSSPVMTVLYESNGDGTFKPARTVTSGDWDSIVAADFNLDGQLDLASASSNSFSVRLGNGDGTFRSGASVSMTSIPSGPMAAGDFDGDGKPDVVMAYGNGTASLCMLRNTSR